MRGRVERSFVKNNRATNGGGIAFGTDPTFPSIISSGWVVSTEVADNVATQQGGGILLEATTVTIEKSTVAGNTAVSGVGVRSLSSVGLKVFESIINTYVCLLI